MIVTTIVTVTVSATLQVIDEDPVVAAIHANAKEWDPIAEYIYGYLQVRMRCCVQAVQYSIYSVKLCMHLLVQDRFMMPWHLSSSLARKFVRITAWRLISAHQYCARNR